MNRIVSDLWRSGLKFVVVASILIIAFQHFGLHWAQWLFWFGMILTIWPRISLFRSPDGGSTVRVLVIATHWMLLGYLMLAGWTIKRWDINIINHPWYEWELAFIAMLYLLSIALSILPIWAVHCVVIRRNGKTIIWHLKFCSIDTNKTDYLWLPDGNSLLIGHSDEHEWYLYRSDLDERARQAHFPFNIVIGRTPAMRRVTFKDDWTWMEKLWRESGFDPEKCDQNNITGDLDYSSQCRNFFIKLLPQFKDFPLYDYGYGQMHEKSRHRDYANHAYRRALECIPDESTAFQNIRSIIKSKIEKCG